MGDSGESLDADDGSGAPKIPTALDSIGGFGLDFMQGVVPGGTFLPMPPGTSGYQLSVALGQLVGGLWDIGLGVPLALGGGVLTVTVAGAPVGVPAAAVGGGLTVAGTVNVGNALGNIVKIGGDTDGGGNPTSATTTDPSSSPAPELPKVNKAVNSKLDHAAERAAERGVSVSKEAASEGLKALSAQISKSGFPKGSIRDTAHSDRVLVPFGEGGYAVYQVGNNSTAKLKTVLIAR